MKRFITFALSIVMMLSCISISSVIVNAKMAELLTGGTWEQGFRTPSKADATIADIRTDTDQYNRRAYYSKLIDVSEDQTYTLSFKGRAGDGVKVLQLESDGTTIVSNINYWVGRTETTTDSNIYYTSKSFTISITPESGVEKIGLSLFSQYDSDSGYKAGTNGVALYDYDRIISDLASGTISVSFKGDVEEVTSSVKATLDGSDLEVADGKVTLPVSDADGFVAYTDGTNNYNAGAEVEVTEDTAFTTVAVGKVEMTEGVSIRINTAKGLRYYTNVDKTAIANATAAGAIVSYGTLIGPKDLGLSATNVTDANSVDVTFDSSAVWSEEGFNTNGFVGSLTNIKDSNRTREFTGIGYVKVTLNGETYTVYASNPYSVSLKDAAKSFVTKAESDSTLKTLYDNHTEFFLYAIAD
jgi:hypothetical protein